MAKLAWAPGALLAPVPPTLVTCGTVEAPKVLTVAWTGILNTRPPKTYIAVRPERASYPTLRERGEFVINLPGSDLVRAVDFCGVRSGAAVDKFAETGLTPEASVTVEAPSLAQCPISLECRVTEVVPLGSHDLFLADILQVTVDERCVDAGGKLHIERCDLLAYAHGSYFQLGRELGTFGYSVRKKPPARSSAGPKAGSKDGPKARPKAGPAAGPKGKGGKRRGGKA